MADNRLIERIELVAAFRLPSVPSELGVAGHAPDFGGNVPLSLQHLCRLGTSGGMAPEPSRRTKPSPFLDPFDAKR